MGCASDMAHAIVFQPFGQVARNVAGIVVAQQSGFGHNIGLIAMINLQDKFQREVHIPPLGKPRAENPKKCSDFNIRV